MKKVSFKMLAASALMVVAVIACKKKEEKKETYTTATENYEAKAVAMTVVNDKLPADVLPSCVVQNTDFDSWFTSGKVTKDGKVNAANSVTFQHLNNCDFYKWSEQMFLWLTSPTTDGDYSKGTVMESPVFYTVTPKVDGKRTLIPHEEGKLMNAFANVQKMDSRVETEEGQATDDVLMSSNGSILYYISMVNDVYAQFLTGVKTGKLNGDEFPTTQAELDGIVAFAKDNGATIQDPEALAIEIKTSWVEASTLKDTSTYIMIDAMAPTYDKTSTKWTPNGTKKVKLALVGAHIVGSTDGHPEMIWATYEHKDNAPNLAYTYLDKDKKTQTVPADIGNDWLLNNDSASGTYNVSHMTYDNNDIVARSGQTISASNTKMINAWGVAPTGVPNQEDATPAASNSQVISVNNSVLGQLADGDMRKNYLFIGATWTQGGAAPDGNSYSANNTTPGVAIGTSQLANSTMETYAQYDASATSPTAFPGTNASCFRCHSNPGSGTGLKPTDLSHIFGAIQPLDEQSTADAQ